MSTRFFTIVYYLGIASCGIQGAKVASSYGKNRSLWFLSSFLSAFGGGLMRDIMILNISPAVFTISSVPDVIVSLAFCAIYMVVLSYSRITVITTLSILADSMGLSQFIAIGVNKAINQNADLFIVLLCGVTTAIGGGILSSLLCGVNFTEVITSNSIYRVNTFLATLTYYSLVSYGTGIVTAQMILLIYTFVFTMVCNQSVRKQLKKVFRCRRRNNPIVIVNFPHYGTLSWDYYSSLMCNKNLLRYDKPLIYKNTYSSYSLNKGAIIYHRLLRI